MKDQPLAELDLPQATLLDAVGGDLDCLQVPLDGTPVEVSYPGMLPTDLIRFCWPGLPEKETFAPIEPVYGNTDEVVHFTVPYDYVGYYLDTYAHFFYTVTRDEETFESRGANVRITRPNTFPPLDLLPLIDETLFLSALVDDHFTLEMAPWPFITSACRVTIWAHVEEPEGERTNFRLLAQEPVTEDDIRFGWKRSFSSDVYAQSPSGSRLFFDLFASFGGHTHTIQFRPGIAFVILNKDPLPVPRVTQAHQGELDIRTFDGDAEYTVAPWPFIQAGQKVWLQAVGTRRDGSLLDFTLMQGEAVTDSEVQKGLSRLLPREDLEQLADSSLLTVTCKIDRGDGGTIALAPLELTLRVPIRLVLPPPVVRESTQDETEGWLLNPLNTTHGATIQVAYDGMSAGDWVCPAWAGTPGAGSPSLECREVVEGETSLEFRVPPSAISANFRQTVTVSYSVTQSSGVFWESPTRPVSVLDISQLPRPVVEQATADTLDLNTFSGDANCLVEPWDYRALEQPCWLWVTGEQEDGIGYSFQVLEGEPLDAEWLEQGVSTWLPRAQLQKLADCSRFEVHFAVNFNGVADKPTATLFPTLTLEITQEDWVLKAPTVREAVGSLLTVYNGRDGVTLRVEYDAISARQSIQPCWKLEVGGCLPLAPKPGNSDPGHVDFHIPREAVIHGIGKTVPINYTVTGSCKVATSADLNLQISMPVRLPIPVVPQAIKDLLDLRTFTGNASVTVERWWFILPGQRVWLSGVGTGKDGLPYTLKILQGLVVTAAHVLHGLNEPLLRSQLDRLQNVSTLRFTCKVTADGSTHESEAVVFPVLTLTVRLPFDDLTTFDNNNWNGWQKGPAAADPRDLVIKHEDGNWFLYNWTYTDRSNGVFLYRDYRGLEPGMRYEFSIYIRRVNNVPSAPMVSLLVEGRTLVGPVTISQEHWQTMKGVFTATATTMRLQLYNHVATGLGNDYAVDNVRVRELGLSG
ncbi:carbohydrate binding domain-containing protein [Pseudomonas asplenii]|nr:carbohydrate binding domain-containing protein [Pseudomonas asplenii]